jgi:glycosyltransferase involved in cell wall biosynthesis
MRIVLAHDWLVGLRGGEWVLDRLAALYGPTTLYTLVSDGRALTPSISACSLRTSPLQLFPGGAGRLRRAYLPLMPWAVQQLQVEPCDLVISTSSAVMKSIQPPEGAEHLCYCHSPARYLWEQTDDYRLGEGGWLRGMALRAVGDPMRAWDRRTADRVTRFIANSRHTAERIRRCYDRDAVVVPPPVRTEVFTPDPCIKREDWYLVVSALEPYKRTDLVIEAANRKGFALRVAGSGSQAHALSAQAGASVSLLGRVSESELIDLYRRAKALIFPQLDDFGIVSVEAQATGCPVLAYGAGGALESVTPATGLHFDRQTPEALLDAIEEFEAMFFSADACRSNAELYSLECFDTAIRREVSELLAERGLESQSQKSD